MLSVMMRYHWDEYFQRPTRTAEVMILQTHRVKGSQGLWRADQQALSVGITTFEDEHSAGRSEASRWSRPQQHCADTASRAAHTTK